jgi:hypothetical protein
MTGSLFFFLVSFLVVSNPSGCKSAFVEEEKPAGKKSKDVLQV